MTLIEFLFAVLVGALIVLEWVKIDQNRQMLDALNALLLRESKRRDWPPRADDATQVRRAINLDAKDHD